MELIENLKITKDCFEDVETLKSYIEIIKNDKIRFDWVYFLSLLKGVNFKYYKNIKLISDVKYVYNICIELFNEPEILNNEEECIVNVREIAQYYATKELNLKYSDFSLKKYSTELEQLTNEHHKILQTFQRT